MNVPGELRYSADHKWVRVGEGRRVRVGITDYLGMYVYEAPDGKTFHSHAFFGMALAHLGTELDRDIMAIHWLTLEDVEALEREGRLRSPLVIKRIRDALAGKTFPMEVLHER